jgi:hypothetical protein
MKKRLFTSALMLALCIVSFAQLKQIHGRVLHKDEPLAKANVMELNANHRIINQTHTDANGYFTLKVSGEKTSVRVTYNGMRKYTHKIGTRTKWEISLDKEKDMGRIKCVHTMKQRNQITWARSCRRFSTRC